MSPVRNRDNKITDCMATNFLSKEISNGVKRGFLTG